MINPTSFDPVNVMNRVFGFLTSASPTISPAPVTKFRAPFGIPASYKISTIFDATIVASSDGLSTTVFPVTKAATAMPVAMAAGKFQGGIAAPTPSGMYTMKFFSPFIGVTA